jgi:excisionase family DNA binding protein
MTSSLWMTVRQVAAESGRHRRTVNDALCRGLLVGIQPGPKARWRINRADFNRWVEAGCPWQLPGRRSA